MALNYVFIVVFDDTANSNWSLQTPSMGRKAIITETRTIEAEDFDSAISTLIAQFSDTSKIVLIQLKQIEIPTEE